MLGLLIVPGGVKAADVCTYICNDDVCYSNDPLYDVSSNIKIWKESDGSFGCTPSGDEWCKKNWLGNYIYEAIDDFASMYSSDGNKCPSTIYVCKTTAYNTSVDSYQYDIYTENKSENTAAVKVYCGKYNYTAGTVDNDFVDVGDGNIGCNDVFDEKLIKKLQSYFDIFKIVVPIIILVLSILDFASSILNSDDDQIKKSQSKLIKRLILAAIFFLLPILLKFILNLVNSSIDTCNIG